MSLERSNYYSFSARSPAFLNRYNQTITGHSRDLHGTFTGLLRDDTAYLIRV